MQGIVRMVRHALGNRGHWFVKAKTKEKIQYDRVGSRKGKKNVTYYSNAAQPRDI